MIYSINQKHVIHISGWLRYLSVNKLTHVSAIFNRPRMLRTIPMKRRIILMWIYTFFVRMGSWNFALVVRGILVVVRATINKPSACKYMSQQKHVDTKLDVSEKNKYILNLSGPTFKFWILLETLYGEVWSHKYPDIFSSF